MNNIKTAIWPVAGLGTRWLPETKSVPKELLPLLNKPVLYYSLKEAMEAGIEKFVFVSSPSKSAIEHYLLDQSILEQVKHKPEVISLLQELDIQPEQIHFVMQDQPLGLGHAVWCAREFIDEEYFAVLSPDDVVLGAESCLKQMVTSFAQESANYCSVMQVRPEEVHNYGVIEYDQQVGSSYGITSMVEKPTQEEAPSHLAIIGRYLLHSSIFDELDKKEKGKGGEIQLTDAMFKLLENQKFYGFAFEGIRFDCGQVPGWLKANLFLAQQQPELWNEIKNDIGLEKAA